MKLVKHEPEPQPTPPITYDLLGLSLKEALLIRALIAGALRPEAGSEAHDTARVLYDGLFSFGTPLMGTGWETAKLSEKLLPRLNPAWAE